MLIASFSLCIMIMLTGADATNNGIVVPYGTKLIGLFVGSQSAFRLSVSLQWNQPVDPISTPMVDTDSMGPLPPFTVVSPTPTSLGIQTSFGQIAFDNTTGSFAMWDAKGEVILPSSPLFPSSFSSSLGSGKDTCANVEYGMDCNGPVRTPGCPNGLKNQTQSSCCGACNNDPNCMFWVMADAQHPDGSGMNCWLLSAISGLRPSVGRNMGAVKFPPGPPPPPPPPPQVELQLGQSSSALFYGTGGKAGDPFTVTSANAYVQNTQFQTSYYWSTDGYSALGVAATQFNANSFNQYQAGWRTTDAPQPGEHQTLWVISGGVIDLYLMPAATMYDSTRVNWDLTGRPVVPPKYAFGFLACRWGWQDNNYINSMLTQFRSGNYPIDAWISDFEWYTPAPDYFLPNTGSPTFVDFGYNNVTFPAPIPQINHYHNDLNMRFGGIRKPRFGNSAAITMAMNNGWLVGQFGIGTTTGSPQTRNLNYSMPDVLAYYAKANAHFLSDGVDFWWNDEGETMYFTFHWWNVAERMTLAAFNSTKRFFSINRAFTPGMQRLGATIWTGDIQVSWQALAQQPGYQMNWGLAGASYVTCDIGGFNGQNTPGDLLARWYQVGVFLGVMRVHSSISNMPHFPFLYPAVDAAAMKYALNVRYMLIPHHYSLAHEAYLFGRSIFRPLVMEFPTDTSVLTVQDQWLSGSRLMVAPIMTSSDGTDTDTQRSVYLPAGTWTEVRWSSSVTFPATHSGLSTIIISNVDVATLVTFVRAGSIILLGPVIQFTAQQPGGPLAPMIVSGADAEVTLYEDDDETTRYQTTGSVRTTLFQWTEATKTLSWNVTSAAFTGARIYTAVQPTLLVGTRSVAVPAQAIGMSGSVTFPTL